MAIKKGDAKYTEPFVGRTDVIVMMSVECGVSFASACQLDYDAVHALEEMIVDVTFVEDEAGQTVVRKLEEFKADVPIVQDTAQTDCPWK